jgi:hypothetical protein
MDEPILDPINRQDFPQDFNKPQGSWVDWLLNNKFVLFSGFLILVLLIVMVLWFFRNNANQGPDAANVVMNIKGPATIASGNETEFRVTYTNGENADLVDVSLEMFYPANFQFASADPSPAVSSGQRFILPLVPQGQTGEVKIRGKVSGATGENKEIRAKLNFKLSNFSSSFFVDSSYRTVLTAPDLEMEITGPIDVTNGQNSSFVVNYKNVSGKEFDNMAVELKYPEGFKFVGANPPPSKNNNYWTLGKLGVGAVGKIELTGSFIGEPGSEQEVSADLGLALPSGLAPQIHASARFKIVASTLSLTQRAEPKDIVQLGQNIQYSLEYANFGSTGQSNVVITLAVEGANLDLTKLKSSNGIVTGNTITWKSATVPSLSLLLPNQKGGLNFTVPVKSTINTNLKNQVIKTSTTIYSDQITSPIRGETMELKLASELGIIISGEYVSGAMPMKVGETTTFNISILATNMSNDLSDGAMIASMPLPASAWANVVIPDSEKANVTFDQNASKIKWRLGNIAAFVGKFSPARTMTFQLKVTPSESNRGQNMTLLRDIQITAMDTFTNQELKSTEVNTLTVTDLNDDRIDASGGTVQ